MKTVYNKFEATKATEKKKPSIRGGISLGAVSLQTDFIVFFYFYFLSSFF